MVGLRKFSAALQGNIAFVPLLVTALASSEPAIAGHAPAFVNKGLVGVGRLAADLRDKFGETFGSGSGLEASPQMQRLSTLIWQSVDLVQAQPGWAFATFNYLGSFSANGDVARSREIEVGTFPLTLSGSANLNLRSTIDLQAFVPSYAFATPVFGGQASVSLMTFPGVDRTSLSGILNGTVTGPGGTAIPFMRSDSFTDTTFGFGDLYPQFTLKWNAGVNNYMVYVTGDVPVGTYSSSNLANIGIGHGAFEAGAGYTYFDPKAGHEISGVLGLTANMINQSTQYLNGVDMHFDWGASQFLSKQVAVGLVGYVYKEIGCDSGSGDLVGCFQSQVAAVGPQISFLFPVGNMQGYLNFKGYGEFAAENRASGWNAWVTFSLSPAEPSPAAGAASVVTKAPPPHY